MHGDESSLQTTAVVGLEEEREREMLESRGAGVLGSMEVPYLPPREAWEWVNGMLTPTVSYFCRMEASMVRQRHLRY